MPLDQTPLLPALHAQTETVSLRYARCLTATWDFDIHGIPEPARYRLDAVVDALGQRLLSDWLAQRTLRPAPELLATLSDKLADLAEQACQKAG